MEKNYLSGLIFQKRLLMCLSLQATARKSLITVSLTVTGQAALNCYHGFRDRRTAAGISPCTLTATATG
ncbi:MAG: hypothetical protein LBG45_04795 [Dysgonamonadaceae bacterium]|jgi:hypothetical protein|nr:hypothetical protein [Dysgonamonadaceae bacterium]